jgi:DNA-binding MarR family transcriptional regulator
MDESLVYTKTPKGMAEVTTRGGALSLASRRVLIMIDGRRTVADLAPLLKPGEIDGVIATLEAAGFVQRVGGEHARPPMRAIEAPPPAAGGTLEVNTVMNEAGEERNLLTLEEAKRRAVRQVSDRLGPDGDQMAQRIERCKNADELRERLREAERLIAGYYNEAAAQDFVRALRRR